MSDSDDLVCLSLRPGLPKLWECRKIIKNHMEVAIGRGENPTLDSVVTHLGRIYDGDIKGNEGLMEKLQQAFEKFSEELPKKSAILKASKPLDRNGNLTEADLSTLDEKEWLNDAIINEYLKLVVKNQKVSGIKISLSLVDFGLVFLCIDFFSVKSTFLLDILKSLRKEGENFVVLSSFFADSLLRGNVERVPDLTNKDVFIPINLNSHWTLALAMYRETTISYFNSMDSILDDEDYNMIRKLCEFFENNYPPGDNSKLTKWRVRNNTNIQAQKNSDDCGVFVLAWTRVIATDLRYLYQVGKDEKQMGELRKVFKQELRENQLMKMPFFDTFDEKIRKALKRKPDTSRPENTEPKTLRRRRRLL